MCAVNPLMVFEVPAERMEAAQNVFKRVQTDHKLTLDQFVEVLSELGLATAIDFKDGQLRLHDLTNLQYVAVAAALACAHASGGKLVYNENMVLE